jgi:hypothetical protein
MRAYRDHGGEQHRDDAATTDANDVPPLNDRDYGDRDGIEDFCASLGKIETWTAQQAGPAGCTSLTA